MVPNIEGSDSSASRTPAETSPVLGHPPPSHPTVIDSSSTVATGTSAVATETSPRLSDQQELTANKRRRRRNKVTYSCLPCRKRRVRCDRGKPVCNSCLKYTAGILNCVYADEGIKSGSKKESASERNETAQPYKSKNFQRGRTDSFESNSNNTEYSYNSNEEISTTTESSSSFKNNGFYLNPNENEDDPFFINDGDFPPITNHDSIFEYLNPNYTAVKESLKAPCFSVKSEKIRTKLIYHQPGKTKFFGLLSYASLFRFQPEIFLIWKMSEGFYINEKKKWGTNKLITILNDVSLLRVKSGIEDDEKDKKFHKYIELFLPNWIIFEKTIKYFYDHLSFFYDFIEVKYLDRIFRDRFKKDELTGKTLVIEPQKSDYSDIALVLSIYYLVRRVLSESNTEILETDGEVDQEEARENSKNGSKSRRQNTKKDHNVEKMYENVLLVQLILFLSEITVTGLSAILIMVQIGSVNKDGEPSEVIPGADLLGRAVSTAYNIGLHIDPDLIPDIFLQNSPVTKKTWRLLWQHVRLLDVVYSSALGTSPLITDVDLYRVLWNESDEEFILCEKCVRLIHKVSKFFSKTVKKLSPIEIVSVFIEVFKFYENELPSFEQLIFQKNSLLNFRKKINVRRLQMKLEILSMLLLMSELIRFSCRNVDLMGGYGVRNVTKEDLLELKLVSEHFYSISLKFIVYSLSVSRSIISDDGIFKNDPKYISILRSSVGKLVEMTTLILMIHLSYDITQLRLTPRPFIVDANQQSLSLRQYSIVLNNQAKNSNSAEHFRASNNSKKDLKLEAQVSNSRSNDNKDNNNGGNTNNNISNTNNNASSTTATVSGRSTGDISVHAKVFNDPLKSNKFSDAIDQLIEQEKKFDKPARFTSNTNNIIKDEKSDIISQNEANGKIDKNVNNLRTKVASLSSSSSSSSSSSTASTFSPMGATLIMDNNDSEKVDLSELILKDVDLIKLEKASMDWVKPCNKESNKYGKYIENSLKDPIDVISCLGQFLMFGASTRFLSEDYNYYLVYKYLLVLTCYCAEVLNDEEGNLDSKLLISRVQKRLGDIMKPGIVDPCEFRNLLQSVRLSNRIRSRKNNVNDGRYNFDILGEKYRMDARNNKKNGNITTTITPNVNNHGNSSSAPYSSTTSGDNRVIHKGVDHRGVNFKSEDGNTYGNISMNYCNNSPQRNACGNDNLMGHSHSQSHSHSHGHGYSYDPNSIPSSIFADQSFENTNSTNGNNGNISNGNDINVNGGGGGNGINIGFDCTDINEINEINEISKIFESLANMENDSDFGKLFSSFE